MQLPRFLKTIALIAALITGSQLVAQDLSQMAFSELQGQANALVSEGRLVEALPLIEEIIKRVDSDPESEISLDLLLFMAGNAKIQTYLETKETGNLNDALSWYERLEKEYPRSSNLKDALSRSVDVYRILERDEDAKKLIIRIFSDRQLSLTNKEENKLMKDFVQMTYYQGKLEEGLSVFQRLFNKSRNIEDKTLAAAALFESFMEKEDLDKAVTYLPFLVQDTKVTNLPQINVAMLQASDKFVSEGRFNEAGILLNIIRTNSEMIQYQEGTIASKRQQIEQIRIFEPEDERIGVIESEIVATEKLLDQLRELPPLRNDLLVRRARNYTILDRPFEAFWMFYDLMIENPGHRESEFYHYAAFSNALSLDKNDAIVEIAREYRSKFPRGDNYEDVTLAFVPKLRELQYNDECLAVAEEFLEIRPAAIGGAIIFAQWASLLLELGDMERIIEKSSEWETSKKDPIYADGIYFWRGLAQSILTNFPPAISDFETLIKNYPETEYLEEGSLRRGIALFYDNQLLEAQEALYAFLEDFPSSNALDQAHYFLGDIEGYAEEYELAIDHFQKSIELTNTIQIVESATFRLGEIYERLERYDDMIAVFQGFIEENPASIVVTDAILQLGRAYEFTRNPNGMLELYRNSIAKEYKNPGNLGIDALIEAYTEKYDRNKTILLETVALLDRLDEDLEFRTKFVTDRGFLFEQFYNNKDLEQSLYNRLRAHKSFSEQLLDDLSPIADITTVYREQLAQYPSQTPEEYFKSLLKTAQAENDRIGEIRMLMGLYRSGLKVEPKEPFTREDLNTASPRVLLYIADLARENDQIEFAVEAWEAVLERFANDDAGIVAYLRLADYNEQIGELETALTKLEAIEKLYPGSPQLPAVILRQGELLTKLGKTDAARKRYQYILKVPDWRGVAHARALLQTGDAYVADKAYDKAHGFYERTFLTYPQFGEWSARAYLADAKVLLKLGSKEDAVTTLQEAVDRLAEAAPVEVFEEIQTKLRDLQS